MAIWKLSTIKNVMKKGGGNRLWRHLGSGSEPLERAESTTRLRRDSAREEPILEKN